MSAAAAPAIIEQKVWSDILQASRTVRVCLPASYESDRSRRYPVLYVQDGQNAFTTAGPHAAFGWGNWELDRTAAQLAREGRMREIIMVAVDCSPSRYREYRGPLPAGLDNRAYERYVRFLREELKPRIDREHRTLPDAASTGLLGSSMGGIFALAAAWEHPETFGLAASLSGAFQVEKEHFSRHLASYRGAPKPIRVYLDSGTADYSGGDDGAANTAAVARELRRIGIPVEHFTDRSLTADELRPLDLPNDKFQEAQRSHHNELYWRQRAWRALVFMFPPAKS
jgi:predicted alpha/beta superfamily hydrolase